jgi:hypothetical protein
VLALDYGRLQAKLRGANGGHVAAGAGADDDHVELVSAMALQPFLFRHPRILLVIPAKAGTQST